MKRNTFSASPCCFSPLDSSGRDPKYTDLVEVLSATEAEEEEEEEECGGEAGAPRGRNHSHSLDSNTPSLHGEGGFPTHLLQFSLILANFSVAEPTCSHGSLCTSSILEADLTRADYSHKILA